MHLKTSNRTTNRPRPVTVHFPLPRKAVSKLRALAIGKDPRLLDLGVLAVQISDDESIVLGIELDKAKKKSSVYANKAASSSFSHSSHERVDFNSKPGDPRSFTTTTTFASPSYNYPGVYTTPHLSTARNDTFVAKTKKPGQNSAAKRRAKETLNAARRGRGRGRAGKTSGLQSNASVRASTWEMVYSHIGIPPEHRNKASNLLEPPVGSQASGIAHVPVAQTELPKENMLKSDSKRKTSVSSPPLKSPGHGAVYSEDDSSVSSSPCSHSPMNSEELMNLFVDSNFSATSVLKQLAESRSKEEKQADIENNNDKSGTDKSFEACVDSQTKVTEPGSSVVGMAFDSSRHWGIFPKNSEANLSKIDNNFITDTKINKSNSEGEKTTTISTLSFGVQPNLTHQNSPSTSTLSSSSLIMSNASVKRSASSLGDLYSGVSHPSTIASQLLTESALHNLQSFKRSRMELEKQTDMVNLSKTNELSLPTSSGSPTSTNVTQLQSSKQLTVSSASSSKYPFSNLLTPATTATTNIALRNYLQYGYYYSSEELNRALAKSASSKNKSTSQNSFSQHSLYSSASSSSTLTLSSSSNNNTTTELLKPKNQDGQPALINSTSSLLSTTTVTANSQVSFDLSQQINESANGKDVDSKTSTQVSKVENSQALLSDVHGNNLSPSNENILKNSQCESSNSCTTSGNCGNPFITIATSSPMVLGSSDVTQPSVIVADSSSSIQKTGRCYAISYVYPMGTVWYPYVAITPYAVLQRNAAESNDTEKSNSGTEAANSSNSTSQYIDLASSLRYWQQLSLLYKNQMLVTASANTNVLNSAVSLLHQNTTANGSGLSNGATSVSSKQSSSVSMMDSENERGKESFSLSGSHSDVASLLHKQPSQDISSNSSDSSEKKPVRRASVIVAAKPSNMVSSSVLLNSEQLYQHRSASSTPESEASSEGMQIKPEALVIDNCDRLIEEHCQRMNEVLADTPEDYSASHLGKNNLNSTTPSLSFIPDSSIAYINVGNNGSRKTAGSGKDGKSKSSKKKKSNKTT